MEFKVGGKYYSLRDPDRYLIIEKKTEKTVLVRGLMLTREKLLHDEDGNEYFEIKDPFKGTFRYSARNKW